MAPRERAKPLLESATAIAAGAASVLLAAALQGILEGSYLLLPLATASLAGLLLGLGPGVLAAVTATLGVPWLLGRVERFGGHPAGAHAALFLFAAVGSAAAGAGLRRVYRDLLRARADAARRERQHAALSRLAVQALAAHRLEPLLRRVAESLRGELEADEVEILEEVPGGPSRRVVVAGAALVPAARRARAVVPIHAPGVFDGALAVERGAGRRLDADDARVLDVAAALVGAAAGRLDAERKVRELLDFSRTVLVHVWDGVAAVDAGGRLTLLNPAAERLLGWSEAEAVGRSFHELVHPASCPAGACPAAAAARASEPVEREVDRFVRKDGDTVLVHWRAAPIRAAEAVTGAVVSFLDVTRVERRRTEDRLLAEVSRRLSEFLDPDATLAEVARLCVPALADFCMVVLTRNGDVRRIAIECADPAGAAAARDRIERSPIRLDAEHGAGRVLRTGASELIERAERAERGDSTLRALGRELGFRSFMAVPLKARDRVLGAIDFALTRSERHYGAEDLALAEEVARRCAVAIDNAVLYRDAKAATSARDEVLAIVSHDLKNPLGAILAGTGVLARLAGGDERLRKVTVSLERAARRMGMLIRDLVDLAAMDAGRVALAREPHEAAEICREAIEMLQPLADDAGLTLAAEVADDLPPALCDRGRLLQVLANLLGNAIRATAPGGRVAVRAGRRGDALAFAVSDTGKGIPASDLPHVFDRYWRGRAAEYGGSGLGLAISRGLVEAQGGQIWAESEEGKGSTFRFTVPIAGTER